MPKKDKIREWIADQYSEQDELLLAKIKNELGIEDAPVQKSKRKRFSTRKLVAICSSVAAAVIITLSLALYFTVFQPNPTPPNKSRYCTQEDYTPKETTLTLKEYSTRDKINLLYFDWYDAADEMFHYEYVLNDTTETIAFQEQIVNSETGYFIDFTVTDNYTEIEELRNYTDNCNLKQKIKSTTVFWAYDNTDGQMYWEYEGYKYYLTISGPNTSDEAFALVAELFE